MEMRIKRQITLASIGLLGVCAIGWSMSSWIWLPHPRNPTESELLRWLVLRDIKVQSTDLQLILVDRFEEELQKGIDTGQSTSLGNAYLERLMHNIAHLKHLWFVTRCRQYELCDRQAKGTFLGTRLKTIWSWAGLKFTSNESSTTDSAVAFFDDIEKWVEEADKADRKRMEIAVRDGFVYWLAHYDLDDVAMVTRQDLARRIVRELNRGMGKELTPFTLTTADRIRLRNNFLAMLEAWFHNLSTEFARLPSNQKQQNQFIDKVLDQVLRWNLTRIWSQLDSSSKLGVESTLAELHKWTERADAADQQKLREFGGALQKRAFWRFMNGKLPKQSPAAT